MESVIKLRPLTRKLKSKEQGARSKFVEIPVLELHNNEMRP